MISMKSYSILKKSYRGTYIEDLKTSNVEHTDEHNALLTSLKSLVTLLYEPFEVAVIYSLSQSTNRVRDLVDVPTLSDELGTDLDLRLAKILVKFIPIDTKQFCDNMASLRRNKSYHIRKTARLFKRNKQKKIYDDLSLLPQYHQVRPAPLDPFA